MEPLIVGNTVDTPGIHLDKNSNTLRIDGNSYPEDVRKVYDPIMKWLESYSNTPNPNTIFEFKMEYFNTASAKMILEILTFFEDTEDRIGEITIKWYYIEDDEDMEEAGIGFQEMVDLKFELVPISE
ncbi:MAG: DUF1987 domain-containing protein [Flavobacteriales bacterium]|nr:DUF1987 domain-containing protein [Flavobacteriales bacterium]